MELDLIDYILNTESKAAVERYLKYAPPTFDPKFLGLTMVDRDKLESIVLLADHVLNLNGDVVECGVWAGGTCILLHYLFPRKTLYVVDSFKGCQDPLSGKFSHEYTGDEHFLGLYHYEIDLVKENFRQCGIEENPIGSGEFKNIKFIEGWVKDTLHPIVNPIKDIALLRIDVDSYSATKEVLYYCFDKVVTSGVIIFDDMGLTEANAAIKSFFKEKGLEPELYNPINWEITYNLFESNLIPGGAFLLKS